MTKVDCRSYTHLTGFPWDLDTFLHWLLTALFTRHLDTGLLRNLRADVSRDGSADLAGDFLALLLLHLSCDLSACFPGNVLTMLFLHLENKTLCSSTACHKKNKNHRHNAMVLTYKTAFLSLPAQPGW